MMNEKLPPQLEYALNRLYANLDPAAVACAQEKLSLTLAEEYTAPLYYDLIPDTPIGPVYIAANDKGLVSVDFGISHDEFLGLIEKHHGQRPTRASEKLSHLKSQISDYLNGRVTKLSIPFDISSLTPFQQQVLLAALQIPRGQVYTYADIARKIGNPKAVRAVGQALRRNPVPIVIPCHRVIAANGQLGGYSGGGGLATKRKLLMLEGAMMA